MGGRGDIHGENHAAGPCVSICGFAGSEITRAERNVDAHPTTLDGGGLPLVISSRNAGYLVSGLDGFTVQNSGHYSNGTIPIQNPNQFAALGGGMRCRVSSPVVSTTCSNGTRWALHLPHCSPGVVQSLCTRALRSSETIFSPRTRCWPWMAWAGELLCTFPT